MARSAGGRRLSRTVGAADDGGRLDRLLEAWLPTALGVAVSRSAVRRLVMAGVVQVDRRVVRRPATALRAGSRVDANVDPARLGPPPAEKDAARRFGPERFLYRDACVLAVDKPAGLPMHATADPSRPNLFDLVRAVLRAEGGPAYLGLHQRLDRDTSGVVLFTLDRAANVPLGAAFASGAGVAKTYHALCARPATPSPRSWRARGPLAPGGPWAETAFEVVRTLPGALLVEARPSTGRKHQIRIQLASAGLPILGDERYAGSGRPGAARVMLHALRLEFTHPLSGAPVAVTAPYPDDFRQELARRSAARPFGKRAAPPYNPHVRRRSSR